ncbi:MAG TPA: CCA tRNA nucleotidyltransferase [Candidatus Acidoferrales bacterium]|nr:CCA tRNA nucleotidyltransferase [Candidatus Acidoferrales bacterium]
MEPEALARHVIDKLRGAGHQAYLVGGCVRDLLLGVKPKDFDIATDARPDRIMDLFPRSGRVGAHFGVVLVRDVFDQVEVATFRSDHDYLDGRHPEQVRFEADPREDVLRRDFTINGLMMDPDNGRVLDFIDGQTDLKRGVVRAIGDPYARFREDHLRLMRAVRFGARLGFTIEAATMDAIRKDHSLILKVAMERVRDELTRILTEGGARRGFELLDESGILADILPEVAAMKGVQQPPEYHPEGDVWTHTLMLLEQLGSSASCPTITLALGALLHDVGKPPTFRVAERIRFDGHVEEGMRMAEVILNRLRYSRVEIDQVAALIANHMKFKDVQHMKESTLKRFLRMPEFGEHLELHRMDVMASNRKLENYELAKRKLEEFSEEALKPEPLITGTDLIAAGYQPGPEFSKILHAVEDAQLEGRIATAGDAMELVREMFPR